MKCPVCRASMLVIEHKRIELDYCPRCHGVWFDSGELELLLASLNAQPSFSPTQSDEKKRRCPVCRRKMDKALAGKPGVVIDSCPEGHGLWFDSGEVEALVKQMGGGAEIGAFLGDVFRVKEDPC